MAHCYLTIPLQTKELDANVFQHRPFLEQDNRSRGYNLVAVGNTFVFPMAGYSTKN